MNMNNFTEGREQWEGCNDGETSIAYTYSTPRGDKWFRCVAKTLEEARARRDDWLAEDQLETDKGEETKMTYFVINCTPEGYVSVIPDEREHLLKVLDGKQYEFIEKLDEYDPQYWGNQVLIIKGEIVIPKPKVVKYDI